MCRKLFVGFALIVGLWAVTTSSRELAAACGLGCDDLTCINSWGTGGRSDYVLQDVCTKIYITDPPNDRTAAGDSDTEFQAVYQIPTRTCLSTQDNQAKSTDCPEGTSWTDHFICKGACEWGT